MIRSLISWTILALLSYFPAMSPPAPAGGRGYYVWACCGDQAVPNAKVLYCPSQAKQNANMTTNIIPKQPPGRSVPATDYAAGSVFATPTSFNRSQTENYKGYVLPRSLYDRDGYRGGRAAGATYEVTGRSS